MSLTIQFQTMIAMIIAGGWVGLALDTYGRFLKRPERARWFVFLNDCLFWILQGLIIFYILLVVNQGALRFYVFIALLCGYAAYQGLLHGIYVNLLEKIILICINIYKIVYNLVNLMLVRPIKILIQSTVALLLFLVHFIWKLLNILTKVILTPIKWILSIIWKLVPEKFKIFLANKAGIFVKIKNILLKWWRRFRR